MRFPVGDLSRVDIVLPAQFLDRKTFAQSLEHHLELELRCEFISITLLFWNIKTSLALLIFSLFSFGVIIAIFVLTPIIIVLKSTLKKE